MIVFGTAVSNRATYERIALAGIRRAAEADSRILIKEGCDSIQRPYNEMLAEAAALPDLEALVLLHQDLELLDDSLPARIRRLTADPRVGLIGALGARGDGSGIHHWTRPADLAQVFGIGATPAAVVRYSEGSHEVAVVDGALLAIAPWAVAAVRFDERLARNFHGYDLDFSLRVGAVGGKVVCDDVPHCHHMAQRTDHDAIRQAGVDLARMWDPALRPRAWDAAFGG